MPMELPTIKRRKTGTGSQTGVDASEHMASLSTLPDELLIEILSYVSQKDTLSLIQAAKRFKGPCQIRLYRRIVLGERSDDPFMDYVSSTRGKTLVRAWYQALDFLQRMHLKIKRHQDDTCLSYIQELVSFDPMFDGGDGANNTVDEDYIRPSELIEFHQLFNSVIDHCPNLTSLVLPLTSVKKLRFLSDCRVNKLQRISILISDFDDDEHDCIPSLTNAERVCLNFQQDAMYGDLFLVTILARSPRLSDLELNGAFGKSDANLRKSLRAVQRDRVASPLKLLEEGRAIQSEAILGGDVGVGGDRFLQRYSAFDGLYNLDEIDEYDELPVNALKPLSTASLSKLTLRNWTFEEKETITLGNWGRGESEIFVHDWMLEMLQASLESGTLEELHIVECLAPNIEVPPEHSPVIQGLSMLLRSTEFPQYTNLKKLTVGQSEECLMNAGFEGAGKDQLLEGLKEFADKTQSQLTHMCIQNYNNWELQKDILPVLVRINDSLQHFTLLHDSVMTDLIRRVVTAKAMKRVYEAKDLRSLDKQLAEEEQKLAEFIYCTHTLDSYEHRELCNPMPTSPIVQYFKEDFIYLYKDEVVPFFKALPKLRTFTLYGYPFKREDVV